MLPCNGWSRTSGESAAYRKAECYTVGNLPMSGDDVEPADEIANASIRHKDVPPVEEYRNN